jgi:hypothetical protein
VDNQKLVLMALARSGTNGASRLWLGDVREHLVELGEAEMHDATINRALHSFADRGWLTAAWGAEDPSNHASSRPRLYFELTQAGRVAAQEVVDGERARVPAWVLDPSLVGLKTRVPFGRPVPGRARRKIPQAAKRSRS